MTITKVNYRSRTAKLIIAAWFCLGIALISLDAVIQPQLAALGHYPLIRLVAEYWQNIGATNGIICFLITGALTIPQDRAKTFITFVLIVCVTGAVVQVVKHLIGRARPNAVHDQNHFYGPFGIFYHGPQIQLDSMPSGHTTVAFAMAVALSYRWPRLCPLWFVLASGVAFARTLVDRHFPSDVIIGSCLGTAIGWGISILRSKAVLLKENPCVF